MKSRISEKFLDTPTFVADFQSRGRLMVRSMAPQATYEPEMKLNGVS